MKYVVAIYEKDRQYGGPEEGGWWYDTGTLRRVIATAGSRDAARRKCRRANSLLHHFERGLRDVGSVIYSGGRHEARIYELTAPAFYPAERPRYE